MASGIITLQSNNEKFAGKITWSSTLEETNKRHVIHATLQIRKTVNVATWGTWTGSLVVKETWETENAVNNTISHYASISSDWVTVSEAVFYAYPDTYGECILKFDATVNAPSGTSMAGAKVTTSTTVELERLYTHALLLTAPNFNDEGKPTITYNNPLGSKVTSLQANIAVEGTNTEDLAWRDIPKTGSSYTFNLTDAERKILRKGAVGTTTPKVTFNLKTVFNGETHTESLVRTLTIINGNPTMAPVVQDSNDFTLTLTGSRNKFIKYYSDLYYEINPAAVKEATIRNHMATYNGIKKYTLSGTHEKVEASTIDFLVEDSRGTRITKTLTLDMVEYIHPTCDVTIGAPMFIDTDNTKVNIPITISGKCFNGTFGIVNNAIIVEYRYKENNAQYGAWQSVTRTLNKNTYNANVELTNLDYQSSYTVQARVRDTINIDKGIESAEEATRITPVFDWGKSDLNVNVPIYFKGAQLLRKNDETKAIVFSGDEGQIFFRPNGSTSEEGQIILGTNGSINMRGKIFYTNADGVTRKLGEHVLLHTDEGRFMNANQGVILRGESSLSQQFTGYILCWYYYNNGLLSQSINYTYIPKAMLQHTSQIVMPVVLSTGEVGAKTIHIVDDGIETSLIGDDKNSAYSPNNKLVLRRIFGY